MNKTIKIVKNLIKPGETLSQKVVKGGFWVFFLRIFNRGFSLIRLIILARILSPNDFGLMGVAMLTMSTLETFSQTGFQQALIQKKENIESYLNSAWTVLILRGSILFIILYFIAPYVAIFFGAPEAKSIIKVMGFSILFQAFTNIGVIYFQKELEFNREFIYQFSGTLADFIVSILAVLILRNVWALVLGLLAGNITRCFVSYLIHTYRPKLNFNLEKMKELFGFGRWIFGSSIIVFLATQGDDLFLGKILGVTALGLYQLAFRLSNLMTTEITHVISQLTFPLYSKLQSNSFKLKKVFLRTLNITTNMVLPLTVSIIILSHDFVILFLGEQWIDMLFTLQILTIAGFIRSLIATSGPLFIAMGRPNLDFWMNFVRVVVMASSIYPLTRSFGMEGTALSVFFGLSVTMFFWWRFSFRLIGLPNL
ncbi:MAG: lipopolysaccharide biosynthesis protein, partial [Candidatus Lokiarchaeota archaeon]|nr:lipopolysaccharide biosynthesis protein [Candidatus Lokiarchaeota archaeon]